MDKSKQNFLSRFKEIRDKDFYKIQLPQKHCQENIWLLKPMGLNCGKTRSTFTINNYVPLGRGIEIFRTLPEFHQLMQKQPTNSLWVA